MLYNQRICVILHLYYQDLWEDIKPYLLNLDKVTSFDLYITITQENKNLTDDINSSFSENVNIHIEQIENLPQGADIYPFIHIINKIDLDKYDILYKIHSKRNIEDLYIKSNGIYLGKNLWRDYMLNEILGKQNIKKCIQVFQNKPKIGAVGFMPLLIEVNEENPMIFHKPSEIYSLFSSKIKISLQNKYKFIGGTNFAIRANILKCIKNTYDKTTFSENAGVKFSNVTYAFEDLMGYIVENQGYRFSGTCIFSNKIILNFLSRKSLRILFKLYVNIFIFRRNII